MARTFATKHDIRCQVTGCDHKIMAKGFCTKHYNADYHKRRNRNFYDPNRGHDGLVPVPVRGWGYWDVPF